MDDTLDRLARAFGIERRYTGIDGFPVEAPAQTVIALLETLGVPAGTEAAQARALAAAPTLPSLEMRTPPDARCHRPAFLRRRRAWGVTCQLYGLASQRNWGIGDFEDLARLAEILGPLGADFVGLSPLHALFLAAPERASPFYPACRTWLNPLLIAVDCVDGFDPVQDVSGAALTRARAGPLIDYRAVADAKLPALRRVFDRLDAAGQPSDFTTFVSDGGETLARHATFQALGLEMVRQGHGAGWMSWPKAFRDPDGPAVAAFARSHSGEVDFQLWLQWQADRQLADAAARARRAGMQIGLYLDLAVGTAPDGAETWSDPALSVAGAEIGAPPDMFNPAGQSWGLAPMAPAEIVRRDFTPVRRTFATALRHAGALRLDHAMSLHRLYWIPHGFSAAEGAYVLYPMPDMVRALAAASHEAGALVIGEDLGVVPEGFRREMAAAGMFGYTLFLFEQSKGRFRSPRRYRANTLSCIGSHDTATLAGWWQGTDICARREIGLLDAAETEAAVHARSVERDGVRRLLARDGLAWDGADWSSDLAVVVHRLLARGRARLFAAQLEDLLGVVDQANIPGTVDEHPNWRRRLPVKLEALADCDQFRAGVAAIAAERAR